MNTLHELLHTVRDALYSLSLSYEVLAGIDPDAPPVQINTAVRDSREAMKRLQIAHENYLKLHEEDK